ncbi:MAG: helix-turn-helix transcriptional regulator [Ruminococcus sp.]|nr:helix-turn-helix transcriptional regulator [Ruminococcus sp.]
MTIKEIRDKYFLTQAELSDITGIPKRTISNWETGNRAPAEYIPDMVEALVQKYQDYLFYLGDNLDEDLRAKAFRVKENTEDAYAEYVVYCRKNNIDLYDKSNQFVQNLNRLWHMTSREINKCETADEIDAINAEITELRALVSTTGKEGAPEFNLVSEMCRARESADEAFSEYVSFCRKNRIDIYDKSNPFATNAERLWYMQEREINKCTNSEDIERINEIINDLRTLIKTDTESHNADFNLKLEQYRAREYADKVFSNYSVYCKKNKIDIDDASNQIIKNMDELWKIRFLINKCKTEGEIIRINKTITELKKSIE